MNASQVTPGSGAARGPRALWIGCLCALVLLGLVPARARSETVVEPLYAGPAPGSEQWREPEASRVNDRGATLYENVTDPTLTAYPPAFPPEDGTAMVLLPGGALRALVIDEDVRQVIRSLNARGVTVFLLKYRLLQRPAAAATAPQAGAAPILPHLVIRNANANPSPDDAALTTVLQLAAADAQVALRRVRAEAGRWRINPAHVGFLGYSAGGGVALAAELLGSPGAHPDFIATAYGPSLMDVHVSAASPPLFIATETLHGPVTEGLLALAALWRDAARPVEMHMYDVPAFAMPSTLWLGRFLDWLGTHQLLPAGGRS